MKKLLIISVMLLLTSLSKSQLIVNDPVNYAQLVRQYSQQLEDYALKLRQWQELVDSNKWLDLLVGEDGVWQDTFKALENIRIYIDEARDVISIVQARDVYALIDYLPVNSDWKNKMHQVLNQAHGLMPDDVFDYLVGSVAQNNPILSDFLIRSRAQGRGGLDHRLNSYYYASARKESTDNRLKLLDIQKNKIETLTDRSQGESTNMLNSQMLLISQQNEEILKALIHQIVNSQTEYFEGLKNDDDNLNLILNYESQRQALSLSDFLDVEQ